MISFNQYITEAADSAQNLHLTHADEDLFERGDRGAKAAVEFILDVTKNLGKGRTKITVKWDGAPAIFAGTDPTDGKFFVGTKGIFNKTPKLYKTVSDIDANESGGKAEKLKAALEELPSVGIPKGKVLQGDMMWTSGDLKYETIDGVRYITVHPNTIVYAWPAESEIGKRIRNSKMGIVWHTTYSGRGELANYRAKFGVDVKRMKQTRTCWMDDAYFKGVDIAFTESEYKKIYSNTMKADGLIGGFDPIVDIMDSLPSSAQGANVKTYINSKVRGGSMDISLDEYLKYLDKFWEEKVIAKVKTEKSKESKRAALVQLKQSITTNGNAFERAFQFVELINEAKMLVVEKLNSLNKQKLFVKTKDGFKATAPEGFVAINTEGGEAVKFVDRLEFSHFNFSDEYIKGWQK